MNRFHRWFCRSGFWKSAVQNGLMPWALTGVEIYPDDIGARLEAAGFTRVSVRTAKSAFSFRATAAGQAVGAAS